MSMSMATASLLRLTRVDAEELGVELAEAVEETAFQQVGPARLVGVGVVEPVQVPAAVGGHRADHVHLVGHHPPQVLGRVHPAGEPAAHGHDHHRVVGGGRADPAPAGVGRVLAAEQFLGQVVGQGDRRGVVEDQGGQQAQPGGGVEPVAQLDRGQRVEPEVLERPRRIDVGARGVAEHGGRVGQHQVQQRP